MVAQAKEAGLPGFDDFDPAIMFRVFDRPKMDANPQAQLQFQAAVAQHIRKKLGEELAQGVKKFNENVMVDRDLIRDSKRTAKDIANLKKKS